MADKQAEKTYSAEEIVKMINDDIAADKTVNAKSLLILTTDLNMDERDAIIKGDMMLTPDMISNTEINENNNAGCSMGAASMILFSSIIVYLLVVSL